MWKDSVAGWARQLRAWARKGVVERELDEEMRFHIELEIEKNVGAGMSAEQARRTALLAFGGVEQYKEGVRDARWVRVLDDLGADARYAARTLVRRPGFSLAAVITLALGIGGTTAVFGVVRAVLLEPLPFARPGQLVRLYQYGTGGPSATGYVTPTHFAEFREHLASFQDLATLYTYGETGADLIVDGVAERIRVLRVSADYFSVLGRAPRVGRTFSRDEETAAPVAILSDRLRRRLDARDSEIGGAIRLDGETRTVIGAMADDFEDPIVGRVDVWVPEELKESSGADQAGNHYLTVIGRLAPGATLERARQEMATLDRGLAEKYPEVAEDSRSLLVPLHEDLVGDARPTLLLLMGAVALVLLIACVNVANLLMVRSLGRTREMAVRAALGAARVRLVRQLLTESLMLSLVGGVAAIGVAMAGTRLLLALGRDALPRSSDVRVDAVVLGFTAAVALLTGIGFGIAPAMRLSRHAPAGAMRESSRGASAGRRYTRVRGALVAAQVAIALVLLMGAGVLAASVYRLGQVDLGVRTSEVLTFELNLPDGRYDAARRAALHREMTGRLSRLPGVASAAAVSRLPATGPYHGWGTRPLSGPLAGGEDSFEPAQQRIIEGDYFGALRIRPREGRLFDARDGAGSTPVAVVSELLAARLFPGTSALGHRIRMGGQEREIIGVVPNVALDPEGQPAPQVYHLHSQFADNRNWALTYLVAATERAEPLGDAVRREVAAVDPQLVMHQPSTLDDALGRGRSRREFAFVLTAVFAGLALTLAVVGLYGVLAYAVRERTREFGIRIALGARPAQVATSVLRDGLRVTGLGLAAGLVGALASGRLLSSLVFETAPTDPAIVAGVAITLVVAAIAASLVPAYRALRVSPRDALAEE